MSVEALAVSWSQGWKLRKGDNSQSIGRLAKDECAFCHGKGHWKKDCPKLQKRNKDKIVSNACVAKFGDNGLDFALVGLSLACNSEEWILDIESTYHMCPYKEWFSCFEEQWGEVVYMGNYNTCEITWIGTIWLKTHDGSTKTLTDVW